MTIKCRRAGYTLYLYKDPNTGEWIPEKPKIRMERRVEKRSGNVVKFSATEEQRTQLKEESKKLGVSVPDYIRHKLFGTVADPKFNADKIEELALSKYSSGQTFTLSELFGDDWKQANGVAGVVSKRFQKHIAKTNTIVLDGRGKYKRHAIYRVV